MAAFTKTTLTLSATLALGILGLAPAAKADTWEHIDQLALRLQDQAEELHDEAHEHFQQTPIYKEMDEHIDRMEQIAVHVHDLAHDRASIPHLSHDLRQLNEIHHRAEHLLVVLGRQGQIDPVAYRHLYDGFRDVGLTARHLRRDLRALEHQFLHGAPGLPPVGQPPFDPTHQTSFPPVGQPPLTPPPTILPVGRPIYPIYPPVGGPCPRGIR